MMPDCRGVEEPRIYSKRAKSPSVGFVPQAGITDMTILKTDTFLYEFNICFLFKCGIVTFILRTSAPMRILKHVHNEDKKKKSFNIILRITIKIYILNS